MRSTAGALRQFGAAVAGLLAVVSGVAHAGGAGEAAPFVVFDASTAAKLPGVIGDAGAAAAVTTGWSATEGRRAAGLQIKFKPDAMFAALVVDANSAPEAFADPEFPPEPEAVVVTCRAAKGSALVIQLADSDGDLFELERDVEAETWRDLRFEMSAQMKDWKRVSRSDGRLNSPLRSIVVGLRARNAPEGRLELARVTAVPSVLQVRFKTRAPGNIFIVGETVAGQISTGGKAIRRAARVRIEDPYGNTVKELPALALGSDPFEIPLPREFGFYYVKASAPGYRPGPASGYTVIPDNRVPGKEPNSPFGVCCHWGDYWYKPIAGVLAKRVGIGWIRDGHHQDSTARGGAYNVSKDVGLCQMSITGYCPGNEKDVLTDEGTYDFSDFMGRQGDYAKGVADHVDWYDMCNEPMFAWSRVFGNSGKPRRWVDIYSRYFVPQYYETIQKSDPGGRLLLEGYTDEIDTVIEAGMAKYIGAISPHSYAHKADPEDHWSLNGGYRRYCQLMQEHNLNWPVWIGEIGFTTFIGDSQHFKSVTELEQAALLVRALTMHFAAGVEKVFYYDMVEWTLATWGGDPSNDAYNCEFHFGLVRKDHTPKPALTAYANLIAQTKGCRWLGRARITRGGDSYAYAFKRPAGSTGLVAWSRRGKGRITVPAGATVTDVFGRTGTSQGGDVMLSEVPVYIHGCAAETLSIAAIPTYAQMPRFFDCTDVRLASRYGLRSRAGRSARRERRSASSGVPSRGNAPATPAAGPRRPSAEKSAFWDAKLIERVREEVAAGRTPSFFMSSARERAQVTAVETDSTLRTRIGGSVEAPMPLTGFSTADKRSLALAVLREESPGDHCLAAFFLIASGDEKAAEEHLAKGGEGADGVEASFTVTGGEAVAGGALPARGVKDGPKAGAKPAGSPVGSTTLSGRRGAGPEPRALPRPAPPQEKPVRQEADPALRKLYQEAETAFIDGEIDRAKELFQGIAEGHPDSALAAKAREYLELLE